MHSCCILPLCCDTARSVHREAHRISCEPKADRPHKERGKAVPWNLARPTGGVGRFTASYLQPCCCGTGLNFPLRFDVKESRRLGSTASGRSSALHPTQHPYIAGPCNQALEYHCARSHRYAHYAKPASAATGRLLCDASNNQGEAELQPNRDPAAKHAIW